MEFYIEPSPVPGQRIPYPTLSNIDEELELSVVVPVRNLEHDIRGVLESIADYFSKRWAVRYEVLVVDICSSDGAHDAALAFALERDGVRILRVPRPLSGSAACVIGCLRTRGRWIFVFNPLDRVPIAEYAAFEGRMRDAMRRSRGVLVAGRWRDAPENYAVLRSTFNALLESLTARLLWAAGVKERADVHDHAGRRARRVLAAADDDRGV
jgi:glycosyltransferase involved in cell wall biosynthesis